MLLSETRQTYLLGYNPGDTHLNAGKIQSKWEMWIHLWPVGQTSQGYKQKANTGGSNQGSCTEQRQRIQGTQERRRWEGCMRGGCTGRHVGLQNSWC